MYFFRFILGVILFLVFVDYIMLALQLWGIITFSTKTVQPKKLWIPFYYWIH